MLNDTIECNYIIVCHITKVRAVESTFRFNKCSYILIVTTPLRYCLYGSVTIVTLPYMVMSTHNLDPYVAESY